MNGHTSRTSLPATTGGRTGETSRHSFLEYDEAGEPRVVGTAGGAVQALSPELPMTVKAARFLGVSAQTVYLWVERKQIPHLRVMGRNIRFLKSDLEPFRAQFKQEVENGTAK
jgi:excisionase family DNA binding protein